MSIEAPRRFEIPTIFITDVLENYIPTKSHDPDEIERRRQNARGHLVLAQQHRGARVIKQYINTLTNVASTNDMAIGSKIAASALLGSAMLSLDQGGDEMHWNVRLPMIADPREKIRLDRDAVMAQTAKSLSSVVSLSAKVLNQKEKIDYVDPATEQEFGKAAAHAALWIAALPEPDILTYESDFQVQMRVRTLGVAALLDTRKIGLDIGSLPSLAMVGGPVANTLGVYLEKHGTPISHSAYYHALGQLGN